MTNWKAIRDQHSILKSTNHELRSQVQHLEQTRDRLAQENQSLKTRSTQLESIIAHQRHQLTHSEQLIKQLERATAAPVAPPLAAPPLTKSINDVLPDRSQSGTAREQVQSDTILQLELEIASLRRRLNE